MVQKIKTGVLLINPGTRDSPKVSDIKKYLTSFLNDSRVIDINPIACFLLVNGIIIHFLNLNQRSFIRISGLTKVLIF